MWRQEYLELKVILTCVGSWMSSWDWDSVSEKKMMLWSNFKQLLAVTYIDSGALQSWRSEGRTSYGTGAYSSLQ